MFILYFHQNPKRFSKDWKDNTGIMVLDLYTADTGTNPFVTYAPLTPIHPQSIACNISYAQN